MNHIETSSFSNPESQAKYAQQWPTEYALRQKYLSGLQCGGCTFYAKFNSNWGLCCAPDSRHWLETVFEHFTCALQTDEGWGAHSFTTDRDTQCRRGAGRCMLVEPGDPAKRFVPTRASVRIYKKNAK